MTRQENEEIIPVDINGELQAENELVETTEEKQPTEEEIREEYVRLLKASKIKFKPIKNGVKTVSETRVKSKFGNIHTERTQEVQTNVIVNQFDKKFKQKRKKKNKLTKASRRANRK